MIKQQGRFQGRKGQGDGPPVAAGSGLPDRNYVKIAYFVKYSSKHRKFSGALIVSFLIFLQQAGANFS